ncbi:MAG: ABC transporter permease [Ignavibacteria bacterium]|jgi:putative ABC transport system permease protein
MKKPPRIARWILSVTNRKSNREIVLGDFEEFYNEICFEKGWLLAYLWFYTQAFKSIPRFILTSIYWGAVMFTKYLKLTFRNMAKHKGYSFINISGFAVGLACFILISMWVADELSYDKFHKNIDRIYRVNTITGNEKIITSSSLRLGEEMKDKYPEIEAYTNFIPWVRSLLKYKDRVYDEWNIYLVDPAFFKMFTFDFLAGDPNSVLQDRYSIVITEETARKYFGDENPIGKSLYSDVYQRDFKVTAVVKKMPANSTLQFNIAGRIDLMTKQRMESWEFSGWTYIELKSNTSEEAFNQKIKDFYKINVAPEWEAYPELQQYSSIHLYEDGKPGLVKLVYLFSAVAIFVLIIAFANFSNLSTARATKRAQEVGVRKVFGAHKRQLVYQFLGEAIVVSFISLIFAVVLVAVLLPYFNQFTGKSLELLNGNVFIKVVELLALVLISGIAAGSYPAFILSSFKPAAVLKGKSGLIKNGLYFRRILTIGQFAISIGLIVCTLVVSKQMRYIQETDSGMERDRIITIANNPELMKKFDAFESELKQNPLIENVTASATRPFDVGQYIEVNWEGHMNEPPRGMQYTMADYYFLSTFGMKLVKGRFFSRDFATDSTDACLINETAASMMDFDNPVGKSLYFGHPAFPEEKRNLRIIGVVKDFHSRSLYSPIGPFVFKMYRPWHTYIFIKLKEDETQKAVAAVESITKKYAPDYPYSYEFLDDSYNRLYLMENKMSSVFNIFAVIATIVSCLGLFGLSAFTAEQRTKEIGIRKTLGASVFGIATMLSKQFAVWIIIANLVAFPFTYYFMKKWLADFVYRIDLNLSLFIAAGFISLVIAVLTVGYQTIKAALSNPVESIKYE